MDDLEIRPLTARSVVLSTLLGVHPPRLPARYLVRVGDLFGIAEGTVRVALSRMVAAGDLVQSNGEYTLTDRLLDRQTRQDESRLPSTRPWDGTWEIAVITAERRPAADRAALRQAMSALRLAELREGTWLRPANLTRTRPDPVVRQCTFLTGRPEEDPALLAATLWDLDAWTTKAEALRTALGTATDIADRFTLAAAVLR
ncbi:PaaX domain-containing protein, C- domain protein, partial [Actinomadura sp. BRA 177]|uniref:PaaX domain-containing protein, C- domain protein n=1 Tax=Actinomadura sp. BRA 177 TaxID=2745202 RepID=UPI0015959B88